MILVHVAVEKNIKAVMENNILYVHFIYNF